ncbi:MAG TPA: malate synthase A [Candidatus Limnocylindria bacterium]|nr:malate synthase A [Candidatus Limnocylindria bacterium]
MTDILSAEAVDFLARLQREFEPRRQELLDARRARAAMVAEGAGLDFLPQTADVRQADWSVAPAPDDLDDRRVEITGPADAKMVINALNSGAKVFMADFEDSLSPTWENVVGGQAALRSAVRRELTFSSPEGKSYALGEQLATLVVRPRGWHLVERHHQVDGRPMSASLFDFGLYLLHNGRELLERGSGPYFYLAKLQGHAEAALWNDVFLWAQDVLGIPRGSICATVLIETIWAAFEMDEILHELREHAAGLNAGRWDYIFSLIKSFADRPDMVLPDRAQVTMAVPFMRAYTQLLVRTCHRRGAHAIGGMSAFIPNRREPEVTARALEKVREDKEREAGDGFDGTWVAHPDLVPLAREIFDARLGERPNQKERLREDVNASAAQLLDVASAGGTVTEGGVRNNVSVALQYFDAWLRGTGAAAINNLMEDLATAEISRSQLWQWRRHGTTLEGGRVVDDALYRQIVAEELANLGGAGSGRLGDAARLLDELVLADEVPEFSSLAAYALLD